MLGFIAHVPHSTKRGAPTKQEKYNLYIHSFHTADDEHVIQGVNNTYLQVNVTDIAVEE